MEKKKTNTIIWIAIVIIVVAAIAIYYWPKTNNNGIVDEATIQCIAQNSKIYTTQTCPHCAEQKRILGDSLSLFDNVDCTTNQQACIDANIEYVPTWEINGEKTTGVFTFEQLKEMTGC
jgi:glutaredoxin